MVSNVDRAARKASTISQALKSIRQDEIGVDASDPSILVRPVNGMAELEEVYRLTHDAYAEQGYCSVQPDLRLVHYPHLDRIPETTVLVAIVDGLVAGTNSWTFDGPRGLHADSDFNTECNGLRCEGRRLASAWRLATRNIYRGNRKVIMALIQETVRSAVSAGVETCVFTFNPRHEEVYRRLLNMKTIARSDETRGLRNAPAVLMRLDLEAVPERWLNSVVAG
jgi:hypothetical protein